MCPPGYHHMGCTYDVQLHIVVVVKEPETAQIATGAKSEMVEYGSTNAKITSEVVRTTS